MEYDDTAPPSSRLIGALREAVTLVQMVLYKEVRAMVEHHHPDMAATRRAMLAGAITNEVFGTPNPDPRYMEFGRENQALIEQETAGARRQPQPPPRPPHRCPAYPGIV